MTALKPAQEDPDMHPVIHEERICQGKTRRELKDLGEPVYRFHQREHRARLHR
jgi:hypothetical protein